MITLKELQEMIQEQKNAVKKYESYLSTVRKAHLMHHLDPYLPPDLANIVWLYYDDFYHTF